MLTSSFSYFLLKHLQGRVFAMNELKTMTAMLLKEFVFTPDRTLPEPEIRAEIMLLCKDGLRVLATPREPV